MELCLNLDGKENLYLRVPTVWDEVEKQWIGYVKTPKTLRLISGNGKNDFDLQNSFNVCMSKLFRESNELADEIYKMFKPKKYWDRKDNK